MLKQLGRFNPKYRGQDVFTISVPRSGIAYSPLLEWRLAARWAGYTFEQFTELEGDEQSMIVASYRANNQIEAVLSAEQVKEMKRAAKAGRGKK